MKWLTIFGGILLGHAVVVLIHPVLYSRPFTIIPIVIRKKLVVGFAAIDRAIGGNREWYCWRNYGSFRDGRCRRNPHLDSFVKSNHSPEEATASSFYFP